jgi:hypothetical protein
VTLTLRRVDTRLVSALAPTAAESEEFDERAASVDDLRARLDEAVRRCRRLAAVQLLARLAEDRPLEALAKPFAALLVLDEGSAGRELTPESAAVRQLRRVVAELGRRFAAAGVLDRADDVLHLTTDELRSLPRASRCGAAVAARRAELAFFRGQTPRETPGSCHRRS